MKTLVLLCIFGISGSAFGNTADIDLLEKNLTAANSQVEILKAQLELIKGYQDKFLSTVYWSLGGVITLAILLIGTNWFINHKNHEKEAELLKENIKNQIDSLTSKLNLKFDDLKDELVSENQKSLKIISPSIKEEIFSKIQADERSKKTEISKIKKMILTLEYDYWIRREVYVNALRTQINLLKSPIVLRSDFTINESLEKIEKTLDLIKSKGKNSCLSTGIVTELTSAFKDYEENYYMSINKLKGILSSLIEK